MKEIANFFYEIGQLKRVKRSGWWLINIDNPESVAEHSFRSGIIGYILAKLENADYHKITLMTLFDDLHETRLNDNHKVCQRYVDQKPSETKAHAEIISNLPPEIKKEILSLHKEFQERKTKEAIIARDADLLENAVQALEYKKVGYTAAQDWIDNIRKILVTVTAKKLLDMLENTNPNDWWKNLKKIDR